MIGKNHRLALGGLLLIAAAAPVSAIDCADIFPGPQAFAVDGSASIHSSTDCNGSSCSSPSAFTVPSLPGVSPSGSFTSTSITPGTYEHTDWGLPKNTNLTFSGSGTAVIYFTGDVNIPMNTNVNVGGIPGSVILVIYGNLTVAKNANIDALIYVDGNATLEMNNDITGALTVKGNLQVAKNGGFDFDPSYPTTTDGGNFCTGTPTVSIDHYEIVHDGGGLTCESESVSVRACTDAACTSLSTDTVTLDLQADAVTKGSPTFTGSTIVSFSHTTAEILTLSVVNETTSPSSTLVCSDGAGSSCDIVFTDAGFRFLYGPSNANLIDNQVAGSTFSDTLKLQAVENVNGVCSGIFTGSVSIDLAQQSISPGNISSLDFTVTGSAIAKNPSTGISAYSTRSFAFGANSIATIPSLIYQDAGQIKLHASYNSGGISLYGASNTFWVRPNKLTTTVQVGGGDLDATTATGSPVHKAGVSFELVVSAYNSVGVVTPNYTPGQIQFLLQRTGPSSGGTDGNFSYAGSGSLTTALSPSYQNVTLETFSSGVSSYTAATYSEVGLLNLDLQDANYGGAGLTVPGDAIDIGRFTPDHFTAGTSNAGSFLSACLLGAQDFTYIGEDFGYLVAPIISIEPRASSGTTVDNYIGSFMHLTASELTLLLPTTDAGTGLVVTTATNIGLLSEDLDGTLSYSLNSLDQFNYTKAGATETIPFTSDLPISLSAINESLDGVSGNSLPLVVTPAGSEIRFGRLAVENTFGSEIRSLPISLTSEYLGASGSYVINTDDYCTAPISLLTTLPGSSPSGSHTNIPVGSGTSDLTASNPLVAGDSSAAFSAPGTSNTGDINLNFDLSGQIKLQYDWNGDGNLDTSIQRTATFGQYRGHDRVIYWREVTQD